MPRAVPLLLIAIAACGHIGFDPLGTGPLGGGDGGVLHDGTDDASASVLPPGGETCATAATLSLGAAGAGSMAGATNDVHMTLCPDGVDIVYQVSVPTNALYHIVVLPTFGGALINATMCPPVSANCAGLSANITNDAMVGLSAGINYLVIEKTSGSGTTFELQIQ